MSGILWLASYPKSGNTWLRVFLTNYWRDADAPADINRLVATPIASARELFDERVGIAAADLLPDEIDALRSELYERIAESGPPPAMKIHDAYVEVGGRPLIPPAATRGAVYLIRNPLDVAVSFAHHSSWPVARAVRNMNDERFVMAASRRSLAPQLRQRLLSWSGHVRSWVDGAPFPVHVVRYEDLKADPAAGFAGIVRFMLGELDERRLLKAIEFSRFDVLRGMEEEHGFEERAPTAETFFRRGQTGSWREALSAEDVRSLVEHHRPVMERFNYPVDVERLVAELDRPEARSTRAGAPAAAR